MELNLVHSGQAGQNSIFGATNANGEEVFSENPSSNNISVYQNLNNQTEEQVREFEEKLKKAKLIKNKARFPDLLSTMYKNTKAFAQMINDTLKGVFVDYYGSKLEVINNQLVGKIYFSPTNRTPGEGEFKALTEVNGSNSNTVRTIDDKFVVLNRAANRNTIKKNFELTKAAQYLLRSIVPSERMVNGNIKIKWNQLLSESTLRQGYGQDIICVELIIDLVKFVSELYGTRTSDGGRWCYQLILGMPIRPVNTATGAMLVNQWQVFIMRASEKDAQAIAAEYGYNYDGNNMGIITTTTD